MEANKINEILRAVLVSGNIVTVKFEEMKHIKKELSKFRDIIRLEIIKSDFENVSFRELKY